MSSKQLSITQSANSHVVNSHGHREMFESAIDHQDVVVPERMRPANFRRKSILLSIAVCAVIIPGLMATVALPAYGASSSESSAARSNAAEQHLILADPQELTVSPLDGKLASVTRDTVGFVEPAPIYDHHEFTGLAESVGPIDITGIAAIAAQYIGVPYVYGGESTSGFDCSGLVAYVYAQVGITLPHSSLEQGEMGTRVSVEDAVPGDVVVMDGGSHVGIYTGGGHMIDAPYPGRVVSLDEIYDNNYWIVHF